jgi:NitT/TauT family transport system permease protein
MLRKGRLEKAGAILLALAIWQAGAMVLDRSILLVSPAAVLYRLTSLLAEPDFLYAIGFSFVRIAGGYFLALFAGSILAVAAGHSHGLEVILWPYIQAIKSVPVASFIILCLIWLSSASLSVFIAFLMVLPIVYANMLQGIKSTDVKLLEMASVFRMPWHRKLKYIHLPHLKPYLLSACSVSIGLSWKAGIAAEVIGIPDGSIGEKLYEAKVYLSSADLFAWTVVIVLISVAFEKMFLRGLRLFFDRLERS